MTTTPPHVDPTASHPPRSPALQLVSDAILTWRHRRGGEVVSLARLRGIRDPHSPGGLLIAVVVSELRDQPRGHHVLSDFAGVAHAVHAQLLPPAADPAAVTWFAHHGQFSTRDPAGPPTLTRVAMSWDGHRYTPPGSADQTLLDPHEAATASKDLYLQPVEELLAALPWDIPTQRHPTSREAGGQKISGYEHGGAGGA